MMMGYLISKFFRLIFIQNCVVLGILVKRYPIYSLERKNTNERNYCRIKRRSESFPLQSISMKLCSLQVFFTLVKADRLSYIFSMILQDRAHRHLKWFIIKLGFYQPIPNCITLLVPNLVNKHFFSVELFVFSSSFLRGRILKNTVVLIHKFVPMFDLFSLF